MVVPMLQPSVSTRAFTRFFCRGICSLLESAPTSLQFPVSRHAASLAAGLNTTGQLEGGPAPDCRTIFVTNVHFGASKGALSRHFNMFGAILKTHIVIDGVTGQSIGLQVPSGIVTVSLQVWLHISTELRNFEAEMKLQRQQTAIGSPSESYRTE